MLPVPSGGYCAKRSSTPLWMRVRARASAIFMTDRTPHEMALVFEALQDAHIRIEALEKANEVLRLRLRLNREWQL